jgi:hypothetical protein
VNDSFTASDDRNESFTASAEPLPPGQTAPRYLCREPTPPPHPGTLPDDDPEDFEEGMGNE